MPTRGSAKACVYPQRAPPHPPLRKEPVHRGIEARAMIGVEEMDQLMERYIIQELLWYDR